MKWNKNTKQFEAYDFTAAYRSAMGADNESRTLDYPRFEQCLTEFVSAHEKAMVSAYVKTFVVFAAGLWAVYVNSTLLAVLLLALAYNYNRQSSHHTLVCELVNSQRMLGMLINRQSGDAHLEPLEMNDEEQ